MFLVDYDTIVSILNDFNIFPLGLNGYEQASLLVLFNILAWLVLFIIIYVIYRIICRLESR